MLVTAFLGTLQAPRYLFELLLDRFFVKIVEGYLFPFQYSDFFILQIIDLGGMLEDCRDVGCNKVSGLRNADDQGVVFFYGYQFIGLVFAYYPKRI